MNPLVLIGIGAGTPGELTLEGLRAIQDADVFFLVDKGERMAELAAIRAELLRTHRPDGNYRMVEIPDPDRDRQPGNYQEAVRDWHEARARRFEQAIASSLAEGESGAFLIWGDPAIYDSALRILTPLIDAGRLSVELQVVPGVSSVNVLAARHRIPLNRVGESVHITTGRKLLAGDVPDRGDLVVMLDGKCSFLHAKGSFDIFWGANLGTPDEVLMSGPLEEVGASIQSTREALRQAHGWVMDIYLLRRREEGSVPEALAAKATPEMSVYEAIMTRRDVRKFRSDPIPDEVLDRILSAAHHAPSVGYSQPWRFLKIRSLETRRKVRELFDAANAEAREAYEGERQRLYDSFKLEGILESPLNLCVLCDERGSDPVLGAQSIPATVRLSTTLAIQNLWLAARAEGVGVGWVSIVDPEALRELLDLPDGVSIVAYLCVGRPEDQLEKPMLETSGWKPRRPLDEVVFEERYGANSRRVNPADTEESS